LLEFKSARCHSPHGKELLTYAEKIYDQLVNAERFIKSVKEAICAGIASMYISIVDRSSRKCLKNTRRSG
jgi:hypothetical protein